MCTLHLLFFLFFLIYYKFLTCFIISRKNNKYELIIFFKLKEKKNILQFQDLSKSLTKLISECQYLSSSQLQLQLSSQLSLKKTKRLKEPRKRSKILEALLEENEKNKKKFTADVDLNNILNCNNVKTEVTQTKRNVPKKKCDYTLKIKKTNNHMYATLIDEYRKSVVCISSSLDLSMAPILGTIKKKKTNRIINNGRTIKAAWEIGKDIAKKAMSKNIFRVHFDRCKYKYAGRVEAFVEGAKSIGLFL